MRNDSVGFFWDDTPAPKAPKKEAEKRQPPEPTWLKPDYLPKLAEAQAYVPPLCTHDELLDAHVDRTPFMFDVECYPNYFLITFRSLKTGNMVYFESGPDYTFDTNELKWILEHLLIVGFYSNNYDIIVANIAATGATAMQLFNATDDLITKGLWTNMVYKAYNTKPANVDHIDLIEVAPLTATLKIYGARMHVKRVQDLPFPPGTWLSAEQISCIRYYNMQSDLVATATLYNTLKPHLEMRAEMSNRYRIDLRSKSDAQIAEAVIRSEFRKRTGSRPVVPKIQEGKRFKYQVPDFIQFQHPELQNMLADLREVWFEVEANGKVGLPEVVSRKITVGNSTYKMGIGGLHSTESSVSYHARPGLRIVDRDVASYYPRLILNQRLAPPALGTVFLPLYDGMVDERIGYKNAGVVVWANGLKIVLNGTFGKLFDPHSVLYYPEGGIQVTITGQLSLLMLIDWLLLAGIEVVSANTDGIVILLPKEKEELYLQILTAWENKAGLKTEETEYRALYSANVNNYIAVMLNGKTKNKGGLCANPWMLAKDPADKLHKNPVCTIVIEAVTDYLVKQIPVDHTIQNCRDISKFVNVRTANGGGAVKIWGNDQPAEYLGKSLRWYYSTNATGAIVYVKNGNNIPETENAQPCGDLPDHFPEDIYYEVYVQRAKKMLEKLACPF